MKIRFHLELDLANGAYDLRVDSPSHPGQALDAGLLKTAVGRVLDNMVVRELAAGELAPAAPRPALLN